MVKNLSTGAHVAPHRSRRPFLAGGSPRSIFIVDSPRVAVYNSFALLIGFNATEEDRMGKKTQKVEVCKCENCGNEGEMTVTCELLDVPVEEKQAAKEHKHQEHKTFTCTKCGNESDMIVDL
jgi:hypothetical protein